MKKHTKLVAILLVVMLIISGNLLVPNYFVGIANAGSDLQEGIDEDVNLSSSQVLQEDELENATVDPSQETESSAESNVAEEISEDNDFTLENYTKVEDGLNVSDTYEKKTGEVSGYKVWLNGLTVKPDVRLKLYRVLQGGSSEAVPNVDMLDPSQGQKETELPEGVTPLPGDEYEVYKVTWQDVELTDGDGNEYQFFVREFYQVDGEWTIVEENDPAKSIIPNWSTSYNNTTVSNRYHIPKRAIKVQKVWVGNPAPLEYVFFQLQRSLDGEEWEQVPNTAPYVNVTSGNVITVSTENNGDLTDLQGNPYSFRVVEYHKRQFPPSSDLPTEGTPKNYEFSVAEPEEQSDGSWLIKGTNTYVIPKVDVTATKTWENVPEGATVPTINFKLIRTYFDGSAMVTDTDYDSGIKELVPGVESVTWEKQDETNDKGVKYFYKVQEVNADGNDFTPENYRKVEDGLNVTNTYDKKTQVEVTKVWDDGNNQDGLRPESVTIKLLNNGEDTGMTLVLTAVNNWTGTFTDLDEYANGKLIAYTVEEVAIGNDYGAEITGDAETGYIVTNSRTPETIAVEGKKNWNDNDNQDGKRPESITIRLLKNGEEIAQKTVTAEDGWAWSFADLAKYEAGELITYTVTEDAVAEYSAEISGYNVTNTHVPGKTSVQVTKEWDDANNQDGLRPESVTIKLLNNGEDTGMTLVLTAVNNWTGTFTDLDEYADGELIAYTVEEVAVGNGYETVITGTAAEGYVVTNSRTPETIAVEGAKTWNDNDNQDGKRPEEITIRLLKNGVEIDHKVVTAEDGWAWSFADLAKYEAGEEIVYTVTEDAVEEYSAEVTGYNVTNTHTPGKVSVQVTKAWADADNQDGVRPESVTIKLFADEIDTEKALVLTADNNWTGTFTDLDEYADGELIAYTVEEVAIGNGYETAITGTAAEGYVVTNSRTPETVAVEGAKTWNDNDNRDGKRPEEITIRLLKNGVEIDHKVVTAEDGWAWSFADLAKYEAGEEIVYTVTEDAVEEYSAEVTGYDVTNTHTPGKVSVQVTKAWADADNKDGVRPESVTIKLLADGKDTEKALVLTAANNWTGTFTDLDEYADGELIAYTVEEVAIGNGYEAVISGDPQSGFVVTNTRKPNPPVVPDKPTEPTSDKVAPAQTGESASAYQLLGMLFLSLGLFLTMIKRALQLKEKQN